MLPSTVDRVPEHTAEHVNERIRRQMEERVARTAAAGPEAIARLMSTIGYERRNNPALQFQDEAKFKTKLVAVYCDSGYRASIAASLLLRHGFKDVRNVPGSWKAWKAAGYEVEKPKVRKKASETDLS